MDLLKADYQDMSAMLEDSTPNAFKVSEPAASEWNMVA